VKTFLNSITINIKIKLYGDPLLRGNNKRELEVLGLYMNVKKCLQALYLYNQSLPKNLDFVNKIKAF